MKPLVSPKDAVAVLNRALAADKDAMRRLSDFRVMCNDELADDPTIQVRKEESGNCSVGLIGILNGIFGIQDNNYGYLAGSYELECPVGGPIESHLTEEEADKLKIDDPCPKCEGEKIILGGLTRFMETS